MSFKRWIRSLNGRSFCIPRTCMIAYAARIFYRFSFCCLIAFLTAIQTNQFSVTAFPIAIILFFLSCYYFLLNFQIGLSRFMICFDLGYRMKFLSFLLIQ